MQSSSAGQGSTARRPATTAQEASGEATSTAVLTSLPELGTRQLPALDSVSGLTPSFPSSVFVSPQQLAELEAGTSSEDSSVADVWQCLAAVEETVPGSSSLQTATHLHAHAGRPGAARALLDPGLQAGKPHYSELEADVDRRQETWGEYQVDTNNDGINYEGFQMNFDADEMDNDGDHKNHDNDHRKGGYIEGDYIEGDYTEGDHMNEDGGPTDYKRDQHGENVSCRGSRRRRATRGTRGAVDDREALRRQRNSVAARKCREGKEQRLRELRQELARLGVQVRQRVAHRDTLRAMVARQRQEIERHRQAGCVFPDQQ